MLGTPRSRASPAGAGGASGPGDTSPRPVRTARSRAWAMMKRSRNRGTPNVKSRVQALRGDYGDLSPAAPTDASVASTDERVTPSDPAEAAGVGTAATPRSGNDTGMSAGSPPRVTPVRTSDPFQTPSPAANPLLDSARRRHLSRGESVSSLLSDDDSRLGGRLFDTDAGPPEADPDHVDYSVDLARRLRSAVQREVFGFVVRSLMARHRLVFSLSMALQVGSTAGGRASGCV